ncbi:7282_t:CDS:2 [Funneliformis mosseae]|uniref:7282_t:CDS:1 n=1 Tax=Funneliformis mosseae TaxID=27381 RepID=A0A9N9A5S4_FUNMO|nr:7282_t:CDS:2 [Funneliformis mosseae]
MQIINGKDYKAQSVKVGQVINGKFKQLVKQGLGERRAAFFLSESKVAIIFKHSQLDKSTPEGLLYHVFFRNAIFLLLRGDEHYKLLASNFKKKNDSGFTVCLYESKANQRNINRSETQANILYISGDPNSLEYVQRIGNWFKKSHIGQNHLCLFMSDIYAKLLSNGASDPEVIALSRHKTIKGLVAYE